MLRFIKRYESRTLYKKNIEKRNSKIKTFIMCVRFKSYYHTLELDSTASAKDIKSAYYKLSLLHHPDKNKGSEESVTKFREISEAYEVLSNPEKKRIYDQTNRFESHYSSNYGENRYVRYSTRASFYEKPYTTRTKDFNYDEHFKQHYENIKKQREMEIEYFRRRWESEFYRKYPTAEDYYRNRHNYEQEQTSSQEYRKRMSQRWKLHLILLSTWGALFLIGVYTDYFHNPERNKRFTPIYYSPSPPNKESSD